MLGARRDRPGRSVHRARRRRHDPARAAPLHGHRRARVCDQFRRHRLSRDDRAGRAGRGDRPRVRWRLRAVAPARRSCSTRRRASSSAINDVAIHRKVGERVAEIAYVLDGEELGSVRCDGLVVATPAGSTGYNLANGGPVMAWGVEGFVVSFIAPHSLTARTLVAAPNDRLEIHNRSREALDVSVDGRPVCEIAPGARSTRGSSTKRASSRSCPTPPSIAVCARSSAVSRARVRAAAVRGGLTRVALRRSGDAALACGRRLVGAMQRLDEPVELRAREASLAARGSVAAEVARVGPATDRRKRHAEIARGL